MAADRLKALFDRIRSGPIATKWHWLGYNFTPGTEGSLYCAPLTLLALDAVDQAMPGYAEKMIKRLERMGGREKDINDYEAIVQWLAELVVVHHFVQHNWPSRPTFIMEPTVGTSKKNPEILIEIPGIGGLGVEVKAPKLLEHQNRRATYPWQLVARSNSLDQADFDGDVTLPRDNPVKDFLISANAKFSGFRATYPNFQSVLFIVWDDFVNEPLSALLNPSSGLFTPNSFNRDQNGAVTYPNIDAVILMRHQHQLRRGMANRPPIDERRHFLDYGQRDQFPPHVLVPNPAGQSLNAVWLEALGAWPLEALPPAAEYLPGEVIIWTGTDSGEA